MFPLIQDLYKILDEMLKAANISIINGHCFAATEQNRTDADVAELADAQASGACSLMGVEVRLLSSALD
jgi:hypothetical protein